MGRPGGGIMALRGHASIQGSTDIPTLFNMLPGYLPMPHAAQHQSLDEWVADDAGKAGFWGNMRSYAVSLLKAYWGDAAHAGERLLLRLPAAASPATTAPTRTVADMIEGQGATATSWSGRTHRSGHPNGRMNGSAWPTSTGWSSATCR